MDRRRLPRKLQRPHREPGRMAGESGAVVAVAGPHHCARSEPRRTQCHTACGIGRGQGVARALAFAASISRFLKLLFLALVAIAMQPAIGAEKIVSLRVWPAQEYTRVTLESAHPVKHQFFFVNNPSRLVVDLEG